MLKTEDQRGRHMCIMGRGWGVGVHAGLPALCLHMSESLTLRSILQQWVEEDNN